MQGSGDQDSVHQNCCRDSLHRKRPYLVAPGPETIINITMNEFLWQTLRQQPHARAARKQLKFFALKYAMATADPFAVFKPPPPRVLQNRGGGKRSHSTVNQRHCSVVAV